MRTVGMVTIWLLSQFGILLSSENATQKLQKVLPAFANALNSQNFPAARHFIRPEFTDLLTVSRHICENPEISKVIVQILGLKLKTANQVNGLLVLTTIDTLARKRSLAFQVMYQLSGRYGHFMPASEKFSLHQEQIKLRVFPENQHLAGEQTSLIQIPANHACALALLLADGLSISAVRLGSIAEVEYQQVGTFENKNIWIIRWPAIKTWKTALLTIQFNGKLGKHQGIAPINSRRCYLLDEFAWHPHFFHNSHKSERVIPKNNFPLTLSITTPHEWTVVTNGELVQKSAEPLKNKVSFTFDMNSALGQKYSGLNCVAAPNWQVRQSSAGQMELSSWCYRSPKLPDKARQLHALNQKIISFFAQHYSAFPLRRCDIVEISDFPLQSRNCGALILLKEFDGQLNDEVISHLAHEIAHAWFGNTIRAHGKGRTWLTEGLAAFSELLFWSHYAPPRLPAINKKMALRYLGNVDSKSDRALLQMNPYSNSERSQAIFQGKGGFIFSMLRTLVGPEIFGKILRNFIQKYAGREATVLDFIRICKVHSSKKLGGFFQQWLDRAGAPEFRFDFAIEQKRWQYEISGTIRQVPPQIFHAPVDIHIETRKGVIIKTVWIDRRQVEFSHTTDSEPVAVYFDPKFQLLRHTEELDRLAFIQQSIRKGNTLTIAQKYDEALKLFNLALAQDSTRAEILYRKGKILFNQQQYHSAFLAFKKAARYAGTQSWIEGWSYFRIAQIYNRMRLRDKAIFNFRKALDCTDTFRLHQLARSKLRIIFLATGDNR